jgi:ADP-heptose:LPS heptosyltransferase
MRNGKKKIALFRALYLGDMLCIIPAVRALRAAFTDAEITLVGLPWQTDFVSRFPNYFDRFIDFPGWPGLPEQKEYPGKTQQFLANIQNEKFDLILQMQGNGEITNRMCTLWGGQVVAGLRKEGEYCPDERLFPVSEDTDHEILRFLKLIDALGIARQGDALEFPLSGDDEDEFIAVADTLGISAGNYICLHPGARDEKRRWPSSQFSYVGDQLACEGYTVVLTGSASEHGLLEEVAGGMKYHVINTIGELKEVSLGVLAALIKYSQLLISNDTGVSHIAAGLKVPSVVIFSPYSDVRRWAPLNEKLHQIISPEQSSDPTRVVRSALLQLRMSGGKESKPVSSPLKTIR